MLPVLPTKSRARASTQRHGQLCLCIAAPLAPVGKVQNISKLNYCIYSESFWCILCVYCLHILWRSICVHLHRYKVGAVMREDGKDGRNDMGTLVAQSPGHWARWFWFRLNCLVYFITFYRIVLFIFDYICIYLLFGMFSVGSSLPGHSLLVTVFPTEVSRATCWQRHDCILLSCTDSCFSLSYSRCVCFFDGLWVSLWTFVDIYGRLWRKSKGSKHLEDSRSFLSAMPRPSFVATPPWAKRRMRHTTSSSSPCAVCSGNAWTPYSWVCPSAPLTGFQNTIHWRHGTGWRHEVDTQGQQPKDSWADGFKMLEFCK